MLVSYGEVLLHIVGFGSLLSLDGFSSMADSKTAANINIMATPDISRLFLKI